MASERAATRFAGRPHLRGISSHHRTTLTEGWRLARTPPGAVTCPEGLDQTAIEWLAAEVPGTVASALHRARRLPSLERCEDFDASDWWYRLKLPAHDPRRGEQAVLRFAGLATLAEVFVDGVPVATSRNMFRELEVELPHRPGAERDVAIRFPALRAELDRRRPRPRWRTPLVEHQSLRWYRTTLLGRMPGWCPPVHAVGPWQPVWLERQRDIQIVQGDVLALASAGGDRLVADLVVRGLDGTRVQRAELVAPFGRLPLEVGPAGEHEWRLTGTLPAPDVARWWPHTHGPQPRYAVNVVVHTSVGAVSVELGTVAFRSLEVDRSSDGFTILVNGTPVFCRGACWTPVDLVALRAEGPALRQRLQLVRDAGMNMLRVSGVMAYEDARFHRWCDELGILVWQDFMFARMDYPGEDAAFTAEVRAETVEIVAARRRYASTAVWCGNSEVAQTAAMLGLDAETWTSPLFDEVIPAALAAAGHDAPYLPTTPTGGPLPFAPASGTAHYYGVGAMLRPLEDARMSGVRFATEALGFSNVGEGPALPSDPDWRARIPRDAGAAWDFEDVRDHYAARLFGVAPADVRRADPERYVAMARVTSAEVMRRTFAEWRRAGSPSAGALVWLLGDVHDGSGWGVLDAAGRPKSPWYALRRVLAPRTVFLTDEGLNGLVAHVANDAPDALQGTLELTLLRDGRLPLAEGVRRIVVPPRSSLAVPADAILGRFTDVAWNYRFGPPSHDVVVIALRDHIGTLLADDMYLPQGLSLATQDVLLAGRVLHAGAEEIALELGTDRLAHAVRIEAGDWQVADNYMHIAPGRHVVVRAAGRAETRPSAIVARAFNGRASLRVSIPSVPAD